jgi:hypothetical protein
MLRRRARGTLGAFGALAALAAGCGGAGLYDIASGPASGQIGGKPWTVATAQTNSFLATPTDFWVGLYAETFTPCSQTTTGTNQVVLSVPMATGDYPFDTEINATLRDVASTTNFLVTQGRVKVDQITASAIVGGFTATFDENNHVSGTFQATICP